MMNGMFIQLYTPGGYGQLPDMAYQIQANDLAALYGVVPGYLLPGGIARLMHFAVACSDDPVRALDEVNIDGALDMYVALASDDAEGYINGCPIVDVPQMSDISDEPVASDLPVLLLNGGLDPATPAEPARTLQATLPNSQYVLFPTGTHIQNFTPCGLEIIDAFVNDPLAPADTTCIPQPFQFAVAQRNSVTGEGGTTLSMEMPAAALSEPGTWLTTYGGILLRIEPAGTPLEEAIATQVAALPVQVEMEPISTEPIAGYPAIALRGDATFGGSPVGLDAYAFEDEQGTYVVAFVTQIAPLIDSYRQDHIPGLLATVTVTKK
jgi:hypothetical protein